MAVITVFQVDSPRVVVDEDTIRVNVGEAYIRLYEGGAAMNRYHSNRGPVEGCPAPDPKEIAANALVYVQQRPSRHVSHVGEGTPHALKFEPVTPEWLALMDKCGVTA